MKNLTGTVTRNLVISAVLALALGAAGTASAAGVGRGKNTDHGPYGLPTLKKVADACSLSHDEEQAVLRVYDDYRHQEHVEMKEKNPNPSGRQDCINAVKQVMTPDEQKKFDSLLSEKKGKKNN